MRNSLVSYPSPSLGRPQTRGRQVTVWSGRCGSAPNHANTGSQWQGWQCKLWHIASQWLITASFWIDREKKEEFTDLLSSVLPTRAKCKETRGAWSGPARAPRNKRSQGPWWTNACISVNRTKIRREGLETFLEVNMSDGISKFRRHKNQKTKKIGKRGRFEYFEEYSLELLMLKGLMFDSCKKTRK